MEQTDNRNDNDHVLDIASSSDASSSTSSHDRPCTGLQKEQTGDEPSTSARVSDYGSTLSPAAGSHSRSSSFNRRGNGRARRRRPLNPGLCIFVELVLTVSQIVAAIVVLSLSRHEHPRTPLFAWIVGYASGCVAILPLRYWRYRHQNQASDRYSSQSHQDSSHASISGGSSSVNRISEGDNNRATDTVSRGANGLNISYTRSLWENFDEVLFLSQNNRSALRHVLLSCQPMVLVDYLKMALDCFFAVWFVVGNVWIFGGHSSASEAPNLYRSCIVFLIFSCIGYAMPFILCATTCCYFPCSNSVLGFQEDPTQSRGATSESIDSLPTYEFKVKKNKSSNAKDDCNAAGEGGIVAAGTEKERVISGEDAVCCICLAKYVNNDELKELPCSHFFHKECVDEWLKINASCPLCIAEVGETILSSLEIQTQ